MAGCPEEDVLVAFAAGQLDVAATRALSDHLDGCPDCLALVGDLVRSGHGAPPPLEPLAPAPGQARDTVIDVIEPPNEPAPSARGPGDRIGPYRIERLLGQGAMGAVYEATHERIGRRVAIKVLHPSLPNGAALGRRLLTEARAVNRVRHRGLVEVHDHGRADDGAAYLVMELLEGETLRARLRRERLPARQALRIAADLAEAAAAAHAAGIVHRDLKPDNVMLVPAGRGEAPKILDFGLAKLAPGAAGPSSVPATQQGAILGTPAYMAPEQVRGDVATPAADVYALGIMVYELLAGARPFSGSAAEVAASHLMKDPPPLRAGPLGARSLVARMLAKDPTARPPMGEVAARLRRLARWTLPALGPSSRRGWLAFGAGALVALALVGGGLLWRRAVRCSGDGWCRVASPTRAHLRRLAATPAGELWAVGDGGVVLRREPGGPFRVIASGTTHKLLGLAAGAAPSRAGPGEGPIWAAGAEGALLRGGPGGLRAIPVGPLDASPIGRIDAEVNLTAVWDGPEGLWLASKEGTILHAEGARLVAEPGFGAGLYDLWGDGRALWAVGKGGLVLRREGGAWTRVPSGTERHLTAVGGTGPADVWIAGKGGALLRFDGRALRPVPSGTDRDLNALWAAPGGPRGAEVWAVGDGGTILRWDGARLQVQRSGVPDDLSAVVGGPDGLWAAGGGGVILHHGTGARGMLQL